MINTILPNPSKTKTKAKSGSNPIHLWVVTSNGAVLVKDIDSVKRPIAIKKVSIRSTSYDNILDIAENKWNIMCESRDLNPLYSFMHNNIFGKSIKVKGYMLLLNLGKEEEEIIEKNSGFKFIGYRELYDYFSSVPKTMEFEETLYFLVHELDKMFMDKSILLSEPIIITNK